jgi:DNA-binding CsgD family transcriptional regulator
MFVAYELTVMRGLLQGKSDQQIATEMEKSIQSVKRYIGNVYRKLNVKNRHEFVALYYQALLMSHAPDLKVENADSKVLDQMFKIKNFGGEPTLPVGIAS